MSGKFSKLLKDSMFLIQKKAPCPEKQLGHRPISLCRAHGISIAMLVHDNFSSRFEQPANHCPGLGCLAVSHSTHINLNFDFMAVMAEPKESPFVQVVGMP